MKGISFTQIYATASQFFMNFLFTIHKPKVVNKLLIFYCGIKKAWLLAFFQLFIFCREP